MKASSSIVGWPTVTAWHKKTNCTNKIREWCIPVNAGRNCCTTNEASRSKMVMNE